MKAVNLRPARKIEEKNFQKILRKLFDPAVTSSSTTASPKISTSTPWIIYNARKEANILSGKLYLELDVWIPHLKLGFEYQVCVVVVIISIWYFYAYYIFVAVCYDVMPLMYYYKCITNMHT